MKVLKVKSEIDEYDDNLNNKFRKKTFFFLIIGFILINILLVWSLWKSNIPFNKYNVDNYRYIFSALLQALAGIFAFIASSSVLIMQLSSEGSPSSIRYFPKRTFILVLSGIFLILVLDTVALLSLEINSIEIKQFLLNFLILYNGYAVLFVIIYILSIINWMKPESTLYNLFKIANRVKTNKERLEILHSIEELTKKSIEKGYSSTIRYSQDILSEIIKIYSTTNIELNKDAGMNPEHPLREFPDVIERLSIILARSHMDNLLHFNGHILRELTSCNYKGEEIVEVEISSSASRIIEECLKNNLYTAASNFIANFVMCASEEDNLNTIFDSTVSILEVVVNHNDIDKCGAIVSSLLGDVLYVLDNGNQIEKHMYDSIEKIIMRKSSILSMKSHYQNISVKEQLDKIKAMTI